MRKELTYPDEESDLYRRYQREAVVYLTADIPNNKEMSVIAYATHIGAIAMLRAVLNMPLVYRFRRYDKNLFDVTNLTPNTLEQEQRRVSSATSASRVFFHLATVDVMSDDKVTARAAHKIDSCLDIIARMEDELVATEILNILPIRQLVQNYWSAYQWIFGALMTLHIVYMTLFSAYNLPHSAHDSSGNANTAGVTGGKPSYGFLVWPCMLLLFELYVIIAGVYLFCKRSRRLFKGSGLDIASKLCCSGIPRDIIYHVFLWIMRKASHIMSISFPVSVIAWFVAKTMSSNIELYLLATAALLGWMYTILFTKGFETVHSLSIMLKHIIIRDVTRFLFIYVFLLAGFGFAMHALFHIAQDVGNEYPTAWHSLFFTFNLLVGMGDLNFDHAFDASYKAVGSSSIYVKIVYTIYMIIATVVLLNMLIAMLSQTYAGVVEHEGSTWRVGSLRLALQVRIVSRLVMLSALQYQGLADGTFQHSTKQLIVPKYIRVLLLSATPVRG